MMQRQFIICFGKKQHLIFQLFFFYRKTTFRTFFQLIFMTGTTNTATELELLYIPESAFAELYK